MITVRLSDYESCAAVIRESSEEAIDSDDPGYRDTTVAELLRQYGHQDKWPRFGHIRMPKITAHDWDLWWHVPDRGDPRYELIPWIESVHDDGRVWYTTGKPVPVDLV
jgi:hypothetical protein